MKNIIAGVVIGKDDGVSIASGSTLQAISDCDVGDRVYVLTRPEDIALTLARDTSSARNVYPGRVTGTVLAGPLVRMKLDCGFPLNVLLTRRSAEEMGLALGSEVFASFKATALRVIKRLD